MLGHLLLQSAKLFTTKRWSNAARFEETTFADGSWFSTLLAYTLALLEEKIFDNTVDRELLLKRGIFHKLPTSIVGNISSSIKENSALRQSLDEIIGLAVTGELAPLAPITTRTEFSKCILEAKDDSLEGNILIAADLINSLMECRREVSFGLEDFKEPLLFIENKLNKSPLQSVNYILHSEKMMKFLKIVRNIMFTQRWNTEVRRFSTSVAGHSWYMALICYFLVSWESYKFSNYLNMEKMLAGAIFHDLPEAVTGDIINPTKNRSKKMKLALEQVEKIKVKEELISLLPTELQAEYSVLILQAKDDSQEGKLLHAADMLVALLECVFELKRGNHLHFRKNYYKIKRILNTMAADFESINYFLIWSLDDFWEETKT